MYIKGLAVLSIVLIASVVGYDLWQSYEPRVEPFYVTIDGDTYTFDRAVSLESLEPELYPFQSFEGFYLDADFEQPFTEEIISESVTLYANVPSLERNTSTYDLTVYASDGSIIKETIIYHGTPINFVLTNPDDPDFSGYYVSATCPDFPVNLKSPVLEDVILYELYSADFLDCT